jgi:PhnB protein
MAIGAYINLNGNCRAAVEFYAKAFGVPTGEIMTYGAGPGAEEMDEAAKNLVMHAEIRAMGSTIMFSDVPPGMDFSVGSNVGLVVTSDDEAALRRLFENLRAGGEVEMDLQETFWSKCYGFLTDKFGIQWQVSHMAAAECVPPAAQK